MLRNLGIHIWNGVVFILYISMEDLKKKYLMIIRENKYLSVSTSPIVCIEVEHE